jgi:glucose-1-phosphate adenylyltransferase
VPRLRVQSFVFRGYWEDVGTIRSYYEANLSLCQQVPPFDFYDANRPIYTHPRFLPATKVEDCVVKASLISEGSILVGAEVEHSLIGIRCRLGRGVRIRDSLLLGADYYESLGDIRATESQGTPPIGVGADSVIEGAIVDKNARIGRGVTIRGGGNAADADGNGFFIREGIVVVPKDGIVADGTTINTHDS